MLSCPHSLTPSLGRECERARARAYTHTRTHAHTHIHRREHMQTRMYTYTIAEKWSSSEIHSMYALLQLELLKTLSNAGFPKCLAAYTRLQLIVESFRPIDFHETDARLYYHHVQLERLLVTRFSSCSPFLPTGYSLNFRAFRYLSLSLSLSLIIIRNNCDLSFILFLYWILSLFFSFFFFFLIGEYGRIVLLRYRTFRIITGIIKYRKTHSGSVKVDMSIYHLPTAFLIVFNGGN